MAIVNIAIEELEKLTNLSREKLIEVMNSMGLDFEVINDTFELDITPNRPDYLGIHGLTKAINTFITGKPIKERVVKSKYKIIVEESLKSVRPFTACAVVKDLSLSDEDIKDMINLQEKIHQTLCRNRKKAAIGIYPLEKIKWPITFKAMKPEEIKFKPLGYSKELNAKEILELTDVGKEYGYLLEDKKEYPVFIDAEGKILSMPPIINSEDTGRVTTSTKEVFIEVSGFDPGFLNKVLAIILRNLNGTIHSVEMHYPYPALNNKSIFRSPYLEPQELVIEKEKIEKLLGRKINEWETLLGKMGLIMKDNKVEIPQYRIDIFNYSDIAEDIAIAMGYETFNGELPDINTFGELDKDTLLIERIADQLVGLSLMEIKNYTLISNKEAELTKRNNQELIRIANSKSSNYNTLRPNLLASILNTFKRWMNKEYPQQVFEIGEIFYKENKEIKEDIGIGIGLIGLDQDFSKAKSIIESWLAINKIKAVYKESRDERFIKGRAAELIINNESIGVLGELDPRIITEFSLEMPISYIEIDLSRIKKYLANP